MLECFNGKRGGMQLMSEQPFSFEAPEGLAKPDPKPIAAGQDPLHWIQDMHGKDPEQILTCIFQDDPLALGESCPRVMRNHGYMFNAERLLESALEEVAFRTSRAELGEIQMDWVESCILGACQRLSERDALDPMDYLHLDQDERYPEFIVEYFNVRDIYAKQASIEFNLLPQPTRLAFYEVFAEGLPIQEYLLQSGETKDQLQTHIQNALQALGCLDPDGIPSRPTNHGTNAEDTQ